MADDAIAVFGSSEPAPGDPLYERARQLGRLLAEAGHAVITGGYGGVMEGASRGAREAGGRAIGVTCAIFPQRRPNPYLSTEIETADLALRTRELIERSAGFVVLPGKAGTLAELSFLWALHRAGCLHGRPVVVWSARFNALLDQLARDHLLDEQEIRMTRLADSAHEVLRVLTQALESREHGR